MRRMNYIRWRIHRENIVYCIVLPLLVLPNQQSSKFRLIFIRNQPMFHFGM